MNRPKTKRLIAFCLASLLPHATTRAADAIITGYPSGPTIAIKGVNGFIAAPATPGTFLPNYQFPPHTDLVTLAADHQNVYALTATGNTTSSWRVLADQISVYDYSSPTPLRTINLPAGVVPTLAVLNSTLYAITRAGALYAIDPSTGSVTSVGTVVPPTGPAADSNWVVRAHPAVGLLVANDKVFAPSISVVDPATAAVVRGNTFSNPGLPPVLSIDSSGLFARTATGWRSDEGVQRRMSLPSLLVGSPVPPADQLPYPFSRATSASDAFDFPYQPTMPALVQMDWTISPDVPTNRVLRRPRALDLTTELDVRNFAAPPGVAFTNVRPAVATPTGSGPSLVQAVAEPAPMPTLSLGPVSRAHVYINLADATSAGVYNVHFTPGSDPTKQALADRTLPGGTTERSVWLPGPTAYTGLSFAYEPVSANLIGNGALDLGAVGWTGNAFVATTEPDNPDQAMYIDAAPATTGLATQLLDLPLPRGAMRFTLDLRDVYPWSSPNPDADPAKPFAVTFSINGKEEVRWTLPLDPDPDAVTGTYSALIDDPAIYGLDSPTVALRLIAPDYGLSVAFDNLTLTSVPEPNTISALLPLAAFLPRAMRKQRQVRRNG